MADKPTTKPIWATATDAEIIVPGTSEQEQGWSHGQQPSAEYFNWYQHLGYRWIDFFDRSLTSPPNTGGLISIAVDASDGTYTRTTGSFLDDGFAEGMRVSFAGFTNAPNNSAEEGRVIDTVTDLVITVTDNGAMVDEAATGNESCTAWVTFATDGGGVHVDGNLHVLGDESTFEGNLDTAGDLTVAGASSLNGDVAVNGTLDVGDDTVIDGDITITGQYKHGDFTLVLSASAFQPTAGAPTFSEVTGVSEPTWTASGADSLRASVQLPVGKRLRSISFAYTRASGTMAFAAANHDVINGTSAFLGNILSISSGTSRAVSAITSVSGDADSVIGAGETLFLTAVLDASGNQLHGAVLVFDEP
jgi:hypothetical protein